MTQNSDALQSYRVRCLVHFALAALLALPLVKVCAQSPASIAGQTIQLTISTGNPPFASSGAFRFLPSANDNSYAIVPISGAVSPSSGTHSYTKTGATTGQLSLTDSVTGSLTAVCTFTTANAGTYILTGISFPGASQSGTFLLYSAASPNSIAGNTITVSITSGASPFASSGAYLFLPASSGNSYNIVGLSGVVNSSGTYSYSQNSPTTGSISYNDSIVGSGFSAQLSFNTTATGTMYLRKSGSGGYQTGTFSMVPPGIVTVWGYSYYGIGTVPISAQSGVTAIAAGDRHIVALKNDGTVVAWGYNTTGQTDVPAGLSGVTAIAAGRGHTVALKDDGTVVAWGYNLGGQTNVPVGLSGVKAIAAGGLNTLALKSDGSVVAWGYNSHGQTIVPVAAQRAVTAVAAGGMYFSVALIGTGDISPPISATVTGNYLTILWPDTAWGFRLQSAFSLSPPITWNSVAGSFQTNGGGAISIVLPINAEQKFRRVFESMTSAAV